VTSSPAADCGPVAWWKFDRQKGRAVVDGVSQVEDVIRGGFKYVEGVRQKAIQFDGYTTAIRRKASDAPRLSEALTVEAWVAPQVYPWNWTAIVDHQSGRDAGYFFGIDAHGQVGLKLSVDGKLYECSSKRAIPLLKWSHTAATFEKTKGILLYINGKPAGSLSVQGLMTPAQGQDLLLGKSHMKMYPMYTEREPSRKQLSNMIFDGLIDEVKIYGRALSDEEIRQSYTDVNPEKTQPLRRRRLPSGPEGRGRFGAYYCNLKYCEQWDALWRGGGADVVVRFDMAPIRLVSWRGISYNPCWVTENGNWFSNEFMERGTPMGCAESMSDKQARYSHVKILESSDARAVLYWRYSPVDILYQQPNVDEQTRWGDWAEEYWTVYPDGIAVRKIVMWSSDFKSGHEWCQSLPIFQPGQRPEDVLDENAFLSLANMAGQSETYRWPPEKPVVPRANIQVVNYKSRYKPFLILTEKNPRIWFAKFRKRQPGKEIRGMSMPLGSRFWWWNHWPVAQLANDGRVAEFPDRPSHSYTSTQDSDPYETAGDSVTKIMLCGLTEKSAGELVPLAKSWLRPAELKLKTEASEYEGYDRTQRAYVLVRKAGDQPGFIEFELAASEESPVINPAFVIRKWGRAEPRLRVNGKAVGDENLRFGLHHTLEGCELIFWLMIKSVGPVRILLLT
jgi:hypothetical protein